MEPHFNRATAAWPRKLLLGATLGVLVSVFMVTQWCFGPFREFTTKRLFVVFLHYFVICFIWGLLTIAIQPLVARWRFDRHRLLGTAVLYLLTGFGFSMVFVVLSGYPLRTIGYVAYGFDQPPGMTLFQILARMNSGFVIFTIIVGACLAYDYVQRHREHELRASKLETQLTKANLDALKSQLQPHFLFNSLNTIASCIREHPDVAEEMIVQLGDLLRNTLDNVKQDEVTMREELEFLQRYVEIEKMRYGDRLIFEPRIDAGVYDAMVPNLLLQPLVENAIRHGVAKVSKPSVVTIDAKRNGSRLCLAVSDTGPGRLSDANAGSGIGLENTSERLKHLYGNQYRIRAENRPRSEGFCVSIEIPCRFAPVAEPGQ